MAEILQKKMKWIIEMVNNDSMRSRWLHYLISAIILHQMIQIWQENVSER